MSRGGARVQTQPAVIPETPQPPPPPPSNVLSVAVDIWRSRHFLCSVVTLLFATVALLITAGPARAAAVFTPDADYRILTIYGVNTNIDLAEYQAEGVTATFVLKSCDTSRADYYSTASVTDGKLKLTSNTLGHVHGSNTQSETVCTVTGTAGSDTEDGVFRLYTVSDRSASSIRRTEPVGDAHGCGGHPDNGCARLQLCPAGVEEKRRGAHVPCSVGR